MQAQTFASFNLLSAAMPPLSDRLWMVNGDFDGPAVAARGGGGGSPTSFSKMQML